MVLIGLIGGERELIGVVFIFLNWFGVSIEINTLQWRTKLCYFLMCMELHINGGQVKRAFQICRTIS
jgi:hypothetical protein